MITTLRAVTGYEQIGRGVDQGAMAEVGRK